VDWTGVHTLLEGLFARVEDAMHAEAYQYEARTMDARRRQEGVLTPPMRRYERGPTSTLAVASTPGETSFGAPRSTAQQQRGRRAQSLGGGATGAVAVLGA